MKNTFFPIYSPGAFLEKGGNRWPGGDGDRPIDENLRAGRGRDEDGAGGDGDLVTPEEASCLFAEFDET